MIARTLILASAFALAACGQSGSAPEAPADAAANAGDVGEAAPANPDASVLGSTPATGEWTLLGDGATVSAGFGVPQSEYQFIVVCNGGPNRVRLTTEHQLSPNQDTTLRIITEAQTVDFPARSFNEGLPSVNAEVDGADPRLDALAATQERFAVEVAGQAIVLPWDQAIARALGNCE